MEDLYGETVTLVKQGDSPTVDRIRAELVLHPAITLEDAPQFYDMEVFNQCVQTQHPLLTLDCWAEVHPSLVTIPVEWDYSIPYGILYEMNPPDDILQFLDSVRQWVATWPVA